MPAALLIAPMAGRSSPVVFKSCTKKPVRSPLHKTRLFLSADVYQCHALPSAIFHNVKLLKLQDVICNLFLTLVLISSNCWLVMVFAGFSLVKIVEFRMIFYDLGHF